MRRRSRKLLVTLALLIALAVVWQRVRFVVFLPLTVGQFALLLLLIAGIVYLALDHLFNRTSR